MDAEVILVNLQDEEIGRAKKMEAHEKGLLHRAFSVFLYSGNQLLLQKRDNSKYHCPGLWTNACCSHPAPGEQTKVAAIRRMYEELGIHFNDIEELCSFIYRYPFNNGITEFECDHVYIGKYPITGILSPNPGEVAELSWCEIGQLEEKMLREPELFTPWFFTCAPMVISFIRSNNHQ